MIDRRRPTQITDNNVLSVDIKLIAQDRRFPELEFKNIRRKLIKIQQWLIEAKGLSYEKLLVKSDITQIESHISDLKMFLQKLLEFETETTSQNVKEAYNSIENQISHFFEQVYQLLPMRILPFLRQETARVSTDVKDLEKQQRMAAEAKNEYELLKDEILKELKEIRARRSEVEKNQGELVAVGLGKDFDNQSEIYENEAKKWLKLRNIWFWVLLSIIGLNFIAYLILFVLHKLEVPNSFAPNVIFTLEYGVVKIALLGLISYAVGFCSRNYNINMGLAATNRHRKNVAETLLNTLSSKMTDEAKRDISHEAAIVMFKHLPVGYIKKEHQNDSGPIFEVIKQASPFNKN